MVSLFNKADNVCYLIYCVDWGYIWKWISDLRRHFVLAILPVFIIVLLLFVLKKIRHYVVSKLLFLFGIHLVV